MEPFEREQFTAQQKEFIEEVLEERLEAQRERTEARF